MARRTGNPVVLADGDWATIWRCECGYGNTGRERCLMCGQRAPEAVWDSPGLQVEHEVLAPPRPMVAEKAGRKATRTVAGIIGVNLMIQLFEVAYFVGAGVNSATAIRIALVTGIAYYALAALWVTGRSASLGLRPLWKRGLAHRAVLEGVIVGGATAIFLVGILRVATGRPVLDPIAALLAGDGSPGALILGILAIVIAAPVVEEFVFRGFLAESLRRRGRRTAVVLSAAAFSLSHLRLAQFRYYLAMGVILGLVYWRRGLIGSVSAHAAFNGMLLLVAVAAAHGPAVQFEAAGATSVLPATYQVQMSVTGGMRAGGPLGARMELIRIDAPLVPEAPELAGFMARGGASPSPDILIDPASVTLFDLPAGQAVSMTAEVDGDEGRVVLIPQPGRLWVAALRFDGSSRSSFHFDDMLRNLRLPPA